MDIKAIWKAVASFFKTKNYNGSPVRYRTSLNDLFNQAWELKIDTQAFYDLYKTNADIRSCVREIAKSVWKNGLYIEDRDGEVVEDTQDIEAIFEIPTLYNFVLDVLKHSYISGELYLVPEVDASNKVVWARSLDPRTMTKLVWKETGMIKGFVQKVPGRDPINFTRDEVAYFQFEEDVNNPFNGMSLLEGIIWEALSDGESAKRNFYFFKNNWVPNAIFQLDGDGIKEEEIQMASDRIKKELTGSENAHKFIVSNWIKDVKTLSMTNKDIEFISGRKLNTEKVCSVFWVPKSILGYAEDVNLANGKNFSKDYIENTIIPADKYVEYIINSFYNKFVSQDLFTQGKTIRLDSERIDETEVIQSAQREDVKLWILTINEIREQRWLEPYTTEEANQPTVNQWTVLLEDITMTPVIDPNE